MSRGEIITVALNGDDGNPRPALVVQSDFLHGAGSVSVCLITTTIRAARYIGCPSPPTRKQASRHPRR